ncbi:DNA repair protein XRCC3 isoform 2-T2 [Spinachia spinachia]
MLLLAFWRLFIGCGRTEEVVARTITTFIDWKHVTSGEMDQLELNPRIIAAVSRAHLKSAREVLCVSGPDLQRLTGLSSSDVQQLLIAAATSCRHHPPTAGEFRPGLLIGRHRGHRGCPNEQSVSLSAAHELHCKFNAGLRLSVGCPVLNQLLRGGLLVGGVTELAGESGAGKTQLALQLCLSVQYPTQYGGLHSGAVYICTEDSFPIKRLQQLIRCQYLLRSDVPPALISSLQFSDRVYIEHVADLDSLQVCLSRRVPLLLTRGLVRLLVVDSFAALFRSEFQAADWLERSKQLLTFSSTLHHLSLRFTTPVLCINQPAVLQRVPCSGAALGQSGDGSANDASSPGDCCLWRPEQRPPQAGGGVCSSFGQKRARRGSVEGGGPRGDEGRGGGKRDLRSLTNEET